MQSRAAFRTHQDEHDKIAALSSEHRDEDAIRIFNENTKQKQLYEVN